MQRVRHLQSGSAAQELARVTCGWSHWARELVADLFRVVHCNMVHTVMLAKLDTWWCKQTEINVRVVNVDVGSAMHRALGYLNWQGELQERL